MRRPSFGGLLFAVVFWCGSLTPSLLPRPPLFQGVVSGLLVGAGYVVGTLASHLWRRAGGHEPAPETKRLAWRALTVGGAVGVAVMLVASARWQHDLHALVGLPRPSHLGNVVGLLTTAVVVFCLIALGRGLRRVVRAVAQRLSRWLPRPTAGVVATLLVAVVGVAFLDGVAGRSLFFAADWAFRVSDQAGGDGDGPPTVGTRSGGPGSLVTWDELGSRGRVFVSGGPSEADLEAFHGGPVVRPVRVYASLSSRADVAERAALVVDELERAGAFERKVLCVVVPTGTGWVDETAAAALEYLWAGDTALATMQYSYLPSWMSHLVDATRSRRAGTALVNAVHARWVQLPEGDRPRLLVFGESLGAEGGQSAFSGIADMRQRTDGALWIGPPNFSAPWRGLIAGRNPGSPEHLPVLDGGRGVRFASQTEDLAVSSAWERPRVVYLQHAADPVVWWTPRLLLHEPDWLREPRGPDVLPQMRWYPLVTFLQVTADLANARDVPTGHGHDYGTLPVDAWAAIAPPPGWTDDDTQRLRVVLAPVAEAARTLTTEHIAKEFCKTSLQM